MTEQTITVFTKPWDIPIAQLAKKVQDIGANGIELPIRPGYQVTDDNVKTALPEAVKVLADHGLVIKSVAADTNETIIRACAEVGIPLLRTMVHIDLDKAGYAETLDAHRRIWDGLVPVLADSGVAIGVQNHAGEAVGSAIGLYHLIEKYDPAQVCAILDMAHCGIAGEPTALCVDLLFERMNGLVNFKAAYRERTNGPEETEADYRTHWTTANHGAFKWSELVAELKKRNYTGAYCLPGEYSDPAGAPQLMGDAVIPYLKHDVAFLKALLAD